MQSKNSSVCVSLCVSSSSCRAWHKITGRYVSEWKGRFCVWEDRSSNQRPRGRYSVSPAHARAHEQRIWFLLECGNEPTTHHQVGRHRHRAKRNRLVAAKGRNISPFSWWSKNHLCLRGGMAWNIMACHTDMCSWVNNQRVTFRFGFSFLTPYFFAIQFLRLLLLFFCWSRAKGAPFDADRVPKGLSEWCANEGRSERVVLVGRALELLLLTWLYCIFLQRRKVDGMKREAGN